MTETIAQHIERSYHELERTCIRKVGSFPMPDTFSMDPVDIVSLLLTFFNSSYETQDYLPMLKQYAKLQGLPEDKLEAVYPDVQKFITDTLRIIKTKEV